MFRWIAVKRRTPSPISRITSRAPVRELAARGHDVVATARSVAALEDLPAAARLALDVTDQASVDAALAAAGELDALVSNAGETLRAPAESVPLIEVSRLFELNTVGALRVARWPVSSPRRGQSPSPSRKSRTPWPIPLRTQIRRCGCPSAGRPPRSSRPAAPPMTCRSGSLRCAGDRAGRTLTTAAFPANRCWQEDRMRVIRMMADLHVADVEAAKSFYTGYLGLSTEEFNLGWVARYTSPDSRTRIQLVTHDASAPEDPVVSVHTPDVEAAYAEARQLGYEIVYPLTREPWGVYRFFVRAPDGNVFNVVNHQD